MNQDVQSCRASVHPSSAACLSLEERGPSKCSAHLSLEGLLRFLKYCQCFKMKRAGEGKTCCSVVGKICFKAPLCTIQELESGLSL